MSRQRYIEESINNATYPAKLPAPVMRLFASKLEELRKQFSEQRHVLYEEQKRIGYSNNMLASEEMLDSETRNIIGQIRELNAKVNVLKEHLSAAGITLGETCVWKSMPKAEVERIQLSLKVREADITRAEQAATNELLDCARELAQKQILALQEKISKVDATILQRVEKITVLPALPSGTEPRGYSDGVHEEMNG